MVALVLASALTVALTLKAELRTGAAAAPARDPGRGIVVIGDSHAWLWAARIPQITDLGTPGSLASNMGRQVTAALALHPRYVVVSAGTNDLNAGESSASVARSISGIVRRIRSAGATPVLLLVPQYQPLLTTTVWSELDILPLPQGYGVTITTQGGDQVSALNDAIRAMKCPVLAAPPGESIDGVHLNEAAYEDLTRQLMAIAR